MLVMAWGLGVRAPLLSSLDPRPDASPPMASTVLAPAPAALAPLLAVLAQPPPPLQGARPRPSSPRLGRPIGPQPETCRWMVRFMPLNPKFGVWVMTP